MTPAVITLVKTLKQSKRHKMRLSGKLCVVLTMMSQILLAQSNKPYEKSLNLIQLQKFEESRNLFDSFPFEKLTEEKGFSKKIVICYELNKLISNNNITSFRKSLDNEKLRSFYEKKILLNYLTGNELIDDPVIYSLKQKKIEFLTVIVNFTETLNRQNQYIKSLRLYKKVNRFLTENKSLYKNSDFIDKAYDLVNASLNRKAVLFSKFCLNNKAMGFEVNFQNPRNNGRTALMAAARKGSYEVCKLLLENGADANLKDKDGKMAIEMIAEKDPYCPERIIEKIKKLLKGYEK